MQAAGADVKVAVASRSLLGDCFGAKVSLPAPKKSDTPQPSPSSAAQSLRPTVRVSFPPQSRPPQLAAPPWDWPGPLAVAAKPLGIPSSRLQDPGGSSAQPAKSPLVTGPADIFALGLSRENAMLSVAYSVAPLFLFGLPTAAGRPQGR